MSKLDRPTALRIARDSWSLLAKTASLTIIGTGKLLGGAHTAVDKLTSLTKEGYQSQRSLPAKSKSQDIDNA
tara:strand:+ start:623 stop:838 length:216 start_codon:yes stop_codon:yes gene_type:complete